MELEEMKAALTEELKEFKENIQKSTAEELTNKLAELEGKLTSMDMSEELKELREAIEAQGVEIKSFREGKETKKSLGEIVAGEFESIKKNVGQSGGSHKFRVERPVNKTTIGLSSVTSDPFGMMLPDWAVIQSQNNRIAPSLTPFMLTPDDHGVIYWVDQTTRTSNAAARSDGDAAGEQVYAWTGYSETVDNISAMVPVHKEALKHISVLEQTIKSLLDDDVQVALDDYCYTGSGTAPQIGGLYTRATAFDGDAFLTAGGFAPAVATLKDLIVSMAAQIMKTTKYNVDTVWLNPYDVLQLKGYKTTDGIPIPLIQNGMIDNIKVVEANSVTAGTCVVGDSSKAKLYSTGAAEIEVGYNLTTDFSKRILTILANLECSLLIRNAEVDAFLKSTDIDADVAAITKAVD